MFVLDLYIKKLGSKTTYLAPIYFYTSFLYFYDFEKINSKHKFTAAFMKSDFLLKWKNIKVLTRPEQEL